MQIEVKARGQAEPLATVEYDFGSDLTEMVGHFKEDVVYNHALASMKTMLTSYIRKCLAEGKEPDLTNWKPVLPGRRKSEADKLLARFAKLPPEEREAILQELKAA